MKKTIRALCAILCCAVLTMNGAMAYTIEKVEPDELFSEEVLEEHRPSDWAANEIDLASQAGLLTEHTSSYFTKDITRFQFAELVVNFVEVVSGESIVPAADSTFADCTETAVLKAYAAGIVNGTSDTTFSPDSLLTREQLAAMLYRAWDYLDAYGYTAAPGTAKGLPHYTDAIEVSAWASQAVDVLLSNEIMKGTSATLLSPKSSCTVEQGILLVYRLYTTLKSN